MKRKKVIIKKEERKKGMKRNRGKEGKEGIMEKKEGCYRENKERKKELKG